jgi:uncharacterized membrane protein
VTGTELPVPAPSRAVLGHGLTARHVVLRHVLPRVCEATVVPSAIFYSVWHLVGVWPALFAALGWTGLVTVRRVVRTRQLPPLVVIVALGLTARLAMTWVSGSTFLYFLLPVVGTTVIAATFFGSLVVGRPLINRLAAEFCPLSDEAANRRGVLRLFRGLTWLWALVLLANATATLVVLLTLSTDAFVAVKSLLNPGLRPPFSGQYASLVAKGSQHLEGPSRRSEPALAPARTAPRAAQKSLQQPRLSRTNSVALVPSTRSKTQTSRASCNS